MLDGEPLEPPEGGVLGAGLGRGVLACEVLPLVPAVHPQVWGSDIYRVYKTRQSPDTSSCEAIRVDLV